MLLRMRQICLVAAELPPVERDLSEVFGLEVCHRDGGVAQFGLTNFLMPVGNDFLEVVAPLDASKPTAAGRYLERRGGDGGYMVIMQCGDYEEARARVEALGVRIVFGGRGERSAGMQLHPRDVPGAIVELRWHEGDDDPAGPWSPAGPDWQRAKRTDVVEAMVAAELQSDDPAALAARWSEVIGRPVTAAGDHPAIELDGATLRFVPAEDGRGEGLGGLDLRPADRQRVLDAAESRGLRTSDDTVVICGTRFRLV